MKKKKKNPPCGIEVDTEVFGKKNDIIVVTIGEVISVWVLADFPKEDADLEVRVVAFGKQTSLFPIGKTSKEKDDAPKLLNDFSPVEMFKIIFAGKVKKNLMDQVLFSVFLGDNECHIKLQVIWVPRKPTFKDDKFWQLLIEKDTDKNKKKVERVINQRLRSTTTIPLEKLPDTEPEEIEDAFDLNKGTISRLISNVEKKLSSVNF